MMKLKRGLGTKREGLRLRFVFAFFGFVIVAFFFTLRSSLNAYKLLFEMQYPEAQALSSLPTVLTTNAVTAGGVTTAATVAIATQEPEGKGTGDQQQQQQQQAGIPTISEPPKQEVDIPVEASSQLAVETTAAVRNEPDANAPRAYDSYNTTDLLVFKDLHRKYLIRRQEELEGTELAHLSTRAKGKDPFGNNITTYSYANFYNYGFNSGFRNQIMAVSMLVIRANFFGHEQLLLDSIYHKDIDGSKKFSRFEFYFDVDHWNSYSRQGRKQITIDSDNEHDPYPNYLPRLVLSDPLLHPEWNATSSRFIGRASDNKTKPYCYYQRDSMLFSNYIFYGKGRSQFTPKGKKAKSAERTERNPADILMLQGALRPNPAMQAIIDNSKKHLLELAKQRTGGASSSTPFRYMTLHARVEPDMQHHPVCRDKKVYTLREIVDIIESKWQGPPPVDAVFLPINRRVLEKEGTIKRKQYLEPSQRPKTNATDAYKKDGPKTINWHAVDNLRLLNQLTNRDGKGGGLWNGTVPVVEFGFDALVGTVYEARPTIGGAIHDYWLALDAHIFIGTEVSSFSHDILAARFFRGANDSDMKTNNYKYLPSGLQEWIKDDMISPPGMVC